MGFDGTVLKMFFGKRVTTFHIPPICNTADLWFNSSNLINMNNVYHNLKVSTAKPPFSGEPKHNFSHFIN